MEALPTTLRVRYGLGFHNLTLNDAVRIDFAGLKLTRIQTGWTELVRAIIMP